MPHAAAVTQMDAFQRRVGPPEAACNWGSDDESSVVFSYIEDMRIGILGSGLMGSKLGTIFARAGHDVVFSDSHSERKLKRLAREARGKARAGTPREGQGAKKIAARLIRDVGFEPVDAGPLRIARYLEPFALAMAQLAYEGEDGPEVAYRVERFGKSRA